MYALDFAMLSALPCIRPWHKTYIPSKKEKSKKDVRTFRFPDRVTIQWNMLPGEVLCTKSSHSFKNNFNKVKTSDGTVRA